MATRHASDVFAFKRRADYDPPLCLPNLNAPCGEIHNHAVRPIRQACQLYIVHVIAKKGKNSMMK